MTDVAAMANGGSIDVVTSNNIGSIGGVIVNAVEVTT